MHNFQHLSQKAILLIFAVFLLVVGGVVYYKQNLSVPTQNMRESSAVKDHWKEILTPEQYRVLREAGTEIPFTRALNTQKQKRKGT